jgi:hypothetical protein
MKQASRLVRDKTTGIWKLEDIKGLTFEQLCSVLDQVLADDKCPERIWLTDLNESYCVIDLYDSHARQLLWQKL